MGDIEQGVRCFNDPRQEEVGLVSKGHLYCISQALPCPPGLKLQVRCVSVLRCTLFVYETHCPPLA